MNVIELLRVLIREIANKSTVKVRGGPAGMNGGAAHPVIPRKPLMGYGKSDYEPLKKKKQKNKTKPVKISKGFDDDEFLDDYQKVLEGLINAKIIFK